MAKLPSASERGVELCDLPDSLLLEIFSYLPAHQLGCVAQTCKHFRSVVSDDLLWKDLLYRHYKIPVTVPMHPRAKTWHEEYERLHDQSPSVLSEVMQEHKDQVLHISFSHSGKMFATSSKDGRIMVWSTEYPCTLKFSANMTKVFSWRYTQFSQFNMTDTLLLVSGVHYGNMNTSGEIAVFDLQEFQSQCRVVNKPYDVFGTWYDNQHLLSGTLYWTGQLNSISALWLNKASQAVESERESVMMCLYRFENVNASSIRTIMIAERPVPSASDLPATDGAAVCPKCGNPQFEDGSSLASQSASQSESENVNSNNNNDFSGWDCVPNMDTDEENSQSRPESSGMEWAGEDDDIPVDARDCVQCQSLRENAGTEDDAGSEAGASSSCCVANTDISVDGSPTKSVAGKAIPKLGKQNQVFCPNHSPSPPKFPRLRQGHDQSRAKGQSGDASSASSADMCQCEKDPPMRSHQIAKNSAAEKVGKASAEEAGAKGSSPSATESTQPQASVATHNSLLRGNIASVPLASSSADTTGKQPVPTEKLLIFTMGKQTYTPHLIGIKKMRLQDVLGERARSDLDPSGEIRLLPNVDENFQGMDRPRDEVDHLINMHGHIVGMALSPDHRYLYVNSRQWPQNYSIQKVLEPPPIAQEIDIHVIDLQTLEEVGTIMRSHKAFTPNDECFFLFLDISDLYVASGAEDKHGYLWDRHYGVCLNRFPHSDVVNSVAFNPVDQEMLVTVSDDFKIKIWRSRHRMREQGLQPVVESPTLAQ